MKKVLGFIVALTIIISPIYASETVGGWAASETFEISAEMQEIFNKATEGIDDIEYEPLGVLGTQIVAGTNYSLLCKAHKKDSTDSEFVIMYIYQDLNGDASLAGTQEIKMEMPESQPEEHSIADKKSEPTLGEKNALSSALSYLDYTAFSYTGLIKQLEYEGYSHTEAVYGADNCGADWNEQAAKCAEGYLEYTTFSRSGLINQLEYEGFTTEQAEYGVSAVGY